MAFHFQREWHPVVGKQVAILFNGDLVRYGIVDAVTQDDAVLWLCSDAAHTRQLFERAEGFEVWIDYKWESSSPTENEIPRVLASLEAPCFGRDIAASVSARAGTQR